MLKRDEASGQEFVLRGILDGYLLFEDRIILFDYKTDKYKESSELIARYHGQLDLYMLKLSVALMAFLRLKNVDSAGQVRSCRLFRWN